MGFHDDASQINCVNFENLDEQNNLEVSMGTRLIQHKKLLQAVSATFLDHSFLSCRPVVLYLELHYRYEIGISIELDTKILIKNSANGKTQMTSIISCIMLTILLLALGKYFSVLPKAVLASIVVVNLR